MDSRTAWAQRKACASPTNEGGACRTFVRASVSVLGLAGALTLAGCSEEPDMDPVVAKLSVPYGWNHPITTMNADPAFETRFGNASTTVAGHTLRQLVTDDRVRVRADDKACSACHDWARTVTRWQFCDHVPLFDEQPTATGKPTDPPAAKPAMLKMLLNDWRAAGCPD